MNERRKIITLVLGGALTLAGLLLLIPGVALLGAPHEGDFVMTPSANYLTGTSALVSPYLEVHGAAQPFAQLPARENLGMVRVHVRSERRKPIFVGIGSEPDVTGYLVGVPHQLIRGGRLDQVIVLDRTTIGGSAAERPTRRSFWVASASGFDTQTIAWTIRPGRWTLVVMNADASPLVDVSLRAGYTATWLRVLAKALGASGAFVLAIGIALVAFGGMIPLEITEPSGATFPVALEAHVIEPLHRFRWLIKWLLAIPHVAILFFLGIAFLVLTVGAFVAILATGRYPRSIFATNLGILRWNWRVAFYAYSALGTDRYPPFRLSECDYPAHLRISYPPHLSRGLALTKWWLLAIPHYLLLAIFSGSWSRAAAGDGSVLTTGGLVPLLVLFAGVALAFTGRYPRGLFDCIVGLHRWVLRVVTYVALMHDTYPPFRIDLGGEEPLAHGLAIVPVS